MSLSDWRAYAALLLASPRARLLTRIGLTLAGVISGVVVAMNHHTAADFDVFWTAASHWQTPYDHGIIEVIKKKMHITGYWPFAYPPTFLLFLYPFGQMPMEVAYPIWTGLSLGLFAFVCSFIVRPMMAVLLMVWTPAASFAIVSGQSTLLMGSLILSGFSFLEKRPLLAGVLLGTAACIKPQFMVMAPIVLWGRWRTVGAAMATGAVLVAASCVFGPEHWLQWPKEVIFFNKIMITTHRVNPSAAFDALWWRIPIALFGVYLAWTNRDVVGLICGMLCITPYAHDYDLVALAPIAITWMFNRDKVGWDHALLGALFMSGLLSKPLYMLGFLAALAVVRSPYWPLKGFGTNDGPPMQKRVLIAQHPLARFVVVRA
jgi:multidrug transporter EmrE-like cation transporter